MTSKDSNVNQGSNILEKIFIVIETNLRISLKLGGTNFLAAIECLAFAIRKDSFKGNGV